MATLPYLTRRGGGRYYLQIRMPHGPAWPELLRLSLHTSDPRMARRGLCNALSWLMRLREAPNLAQQAEEITAQCRQFTRAGPAATWQQREDRQRFELTFSRFAVEARNYNIPEEVSLALMREWEFFQNALRRDGIRLYERNPPGGAAAPPLLPQDPADGSENEPARRAAEPKPLRRRGSARRKTSDLLAAYLEARRQSDGNDKARGDVGIYVDFMTALLGDLPLADYADEGFARLGRELANIPNTHGIPRRAIGCLHDRYLYAKQHGWTRLTRLSETTILSRYKTGLEQFLGWAHAQGHIGRVVRINVVLSADNLVALPRDSFTDEEIELILGMPTFTGCQEANTWAAGDCLIQDHIYWGYVVMLLTGMRTSEVAQLGIKDIIEDGGYHYLNLQPFDPGQGRVARKELRRLKTADSARVIPLDLLLIDLGLLDRASELAACGETRLFPDWTPYVKTTGEIQWDRPLTRDWQYRRKKLGLPRKNITLSTAAGTAWATGSTRRRSRQGSGTASWGMFHPERRVATAANARLIPRSRWFSKSWRHPP